MERRRKGVRNGKGGRIGMKKMGERLMETQEHDEHIGKTSQRVTKLFSKTTSSFFITMPVL